MKHLFFAYLFHKYFNLYLYKKNCTCLGTEKLTLLHSLVDNLAPFLLKYDLMVFQNYHIHLQFAKLKETKDNIFSSKHGVQNLQIVEHGSLLEDCFCIITALNFPP
jgi:hypothetical protein